MQIQAKEIKENIYSFPHWSKVDKTYTGAIKKVIDEIKKTRPTYNWLENFLDEDHIKETSRKVEGIKKLTKKGIITIEVQLGQKYKGKSVKQARESFIANEFGLGLYEMACILLAKPSILQSFNDLWIDCSGDDVDYPVSFVRFDRAADLRYGGGELEFGAGPLDGPDARFGSGSGFLPQSLETRVLDTSESLTLESAIKIVKEAGLEVIKRY